MIFFALIMTLMADRAFAEAIEEPIARPAFFSTGISFGLASDLSPQVCSSERAGSGVILDVWKAVSEDMALGVQTIASGSLNERTAYQRLTSGILLSLSLPWEFRLRISQGRYSESGNDAKKDAYRSTGNITNFSVLRPISKSKSWTLSSLTHWALHSGSHEMGPASTVQLQPRPKSGISGHTRGFALSIEIPVTSP